MAKKRRKDSRAKMTAAPVDDRRGESSAAKGRSSPMIDSEIKSSRPTVRPTSNRSHWFWLIPILGTLVYLNTLRFDFAYDDHGLVTRNPMIESVANIPKLYKTHYMGGNEYSRDRGLYRPFVLTTYAIQNRLHGLKPFGFHLVNIVLHVIVSVLLYGLVRHLFENEFIAVVSALFFAVHTIHTEAVANVIGRAEILALLGILGACFAYFIAVEKNGIKVFLWGGLSVFAYVIGMYSKEGGIVMPAVIVMTEILMPHRRYLLRGQRHAVVIFALHIGAICLFLYMRSNAIISSGSHSLLLKLESQHRIFTGLRVCMEYLSLLFVPVNLSADYTVQQVPFAKSILEPGVLAASMILILLFVAIWKLWHRLPAFVWGTFLFLITLFPVSNLAFPIGILKAERVLYSPSAGFIVAVTAIASGLWNLSKARIAVVVVISILVSGLSALTWSRNYDWKDNFTLAKATLETSPNSQAFNNILAISYKENKQYKEAREHILKQLEGRPKDKFLLVNLADILAAEGNVDAAVDYYEKAIKADANYPPALDNLGRLLFNRGRYQEASDYLIRALDVKPGNRDIIVALAFSEHNLGNYEKTVEYYTRLTENHMIGIQDLNVLGISYYKLKDYKQAAKIFEQILEQDAGFEDGYANLLAVYIQGNQYSKAVTVAKEGQKRFPGNSSIRKNADMILRKTGN